MHKQKGCSGEFVPNFFARQYEHSTATLAKIIQESDAENLMHGMFQDKKNFAHILLESFMNAEPNGHRFTCMRFFPRPWGYAVC